MYPMNIIIGHCHKQNCEKVKSRTFAFRGSEYIHHGVTTFVQHTYPPTVSPYLVSEFTFVKKIRKPTDDFVSSSIVAVIDAL